LWDFASATPPLHPTKLIYKLNNYVKELFFNPILPNGTNIEEGNSTKNNLFKHNQSTGSASWEGN
jgi:hypothetical protein